MKRGAAPLAAAPPPELPPWWPHAQCSATVGLDAAEWHVQHWPNARLQRAPLALLLHGTGASSHSFAGLAPLLAAGPFEVLAVDLPGHGFTRTPATQALSLPAVATALAALLKSIDAAPALIVGHSAGAAIALQLAMQGDDRPALLVAINGALMPLFGPAGRWFAPIARTLTQQPLVAPAFAMLAAWPGVTRRLLDGTGSAVPAASERCYRHLLRRPAHVAGTLRLMADWDLDPLWAGLGGIRTPVQLIAGADDRMVPAWQSARVRERLCDAQLTELAGLGHLAHEEAPRQVCDSISAAWAQSL
jgi:magnesium chelatase accessory protein